MATTITPKNPEDAAKMPSPKLTDSAGSSDPAEHDSVKSHADRDKPIRDEIESASRDYPVNPANVAMLKAREAEADAKREGRTLKRKYRVVPKGDEGAAATIDCDTPEDAVRIFNAGTKYTALSRNQLDIVELPSDLTDIALSRMEEQTDRIRKLDDEDRARFGRVLTPAEREAMAVGRVGPAVPLR